MKSRIAFFSVLQEAATAWAKLPQESEVRPLPAFSCA
ncbi:Uncharacterised protein [Vibrio cholerae]|nr:Uncharacterised protein [Vibrio cholerae]CSI58484.1 Uncharacterised protein [Vibrio cholerae]